MLEKCSGKCLLRELGSSNLEVTKEQAGEPQDVDFPCDKFPLVAPCAVIQSTRGSVLQSLFPSRELEVRLGLPFRYQHLDNLSYLISVFLSVHRALLRIK